MREYIKRPAQRIAAFFLAIFLTLGAMPAATAEGAAPNDLSGKIGNIHVNMTLKRATAPLSPLSSTIRRTRISPVPWSQAAPLFSTFHGRSQRTIFMAG